MNSYDLKGHHNSLLFLHGCSIPGLQCVYFLVQLINAKQELTKTEWAQDHLLVTNSRVPMVEISYML